MNLLLEPEEHERPLAKVLLFFPRFASPPYPVWQPLEIMTLTAGLLEAGYAVHVIDDRLVEDGADALLRAAEGCLFAGFSARPGEQMARVVELLPRLSAAHPEVPVVLGGWFPSNFSRETLGLDHVDVVVKGQGDRSVVELAERMRKGEDLGGLPGVHFRRGEDVVLNPPRPLEDMNATARIPYGRFPVEQYVTFDRCISLTTSRGCVGECSFCAVPPLYGGHWTGYDPERVLDEVEYFVREHGVRIVKFHDVDFLSDVDRARTIASGLIERGLSIRWVCDGRIQSMLGYDEDLWCLLRGSGCAEIETGGESGNDGRLASIRKECSAEEVFEASRLIVEHGIAARVNFILGLPQETRRELLDTVRLIDRVHSLGPLTKLQLYRFTPWPASSMGAHTWSFMGRGHDGHVPDTAAEILDIPINFHDAHMFWVTAAHERRVKRLFHFYMPLAYYVPDGGVVRSRRWLLRAMKILARARILRMWTAFPWECFLAKRLFGYCLPRTATFEWQQHLV